MSPLKDELIKGVAQQMELPIEMIQAIISFQGEDAARAAFEHKEIEFSGFGKFMISQKRTRNKLNNMQKKLEEGRVEEKLMTSYVLHMEALKKKLDAE